MTDETEITPETHTMYDPDHDGQFESDGIESHPTEDFVHQLALAVLYDDNEIESINDIEPVFPNDWQQETFEDVQAVIESDDTDYDDVIDVVVNETGWTEDNIEMWRNDQENLSILVDH